MKTLHISKFSIFMISIVVFAIVVYGIIVLTSPSAISKQNDRIYLYPSAFTDSSTGYVKVSDMKPNGFGYFIVLMHQTLDTPSLDTFFAHRYDLLGIME